MARSKVSDWALGLTTPDFKTVEAILLELEQYLTLRTYLEGYQLSSADKDVWTALRTNRVANGFLRKGSLTNVARWFSFIETTHPEIQGEIKAAQAKGKEKRAAASKAGGNYNIGLKNTENGVVTRFPPEPSGYLHIGHAKAAFLNDYFAHEAFDGKLIVRFDDTNPVKEKQEFEDSIIEDLHLLGIKPDRVTYTSDYFQQLYEICQRMIADGNAYADDTDPEIQTQDRRNRLPSKRRDRPSHESLAIFQEMKDGTEFGKKHCIRAKIVFDSLNGAMRDPVIYRFPKFNKEEGKEPEPVPHHRTGWAWNIYPTYDFACPVVDSIEGVTHALRTTEYADRNAQYQWFLETLKLRPVQLWDFARINFIRTFLSKRKLTKVVDTGIVTSWDDPRMPTVRGILRRGLTVSALREFMLKQGPSRNAVTMDWTILWATNKKAIDSVAPRHTAVETSQLVVTVIQGGPISPYSEERSKHPKNAAIGTKLVTYASTVLIDQADASSFALNEEITLMNWGNAIVRDIARDGTTVTGLQLELNLKGDFRKTEKKVTWLAKDGSSLVDAELWDFDYLLTKDTLGKDDELDNFLATNTATLTEALCDANLATVGQNSIIQLERKGYFRVDKAAGQGPHCKVVLFKIPTGAKE
ncbi:tRNA synthetases class I, catalytic domain-containing protein [Corynascus novoguineensis]|uniref:glutamate--tRNA ligase n=1 Tax=Corynascus novoguineensis TaxID=1126955 RepID=A0AAN7CLS4_9PEZI|nr:tRNA synthetases class I, catalytic domain-containing protein [Corynascus novoguineensis]